MIGLTLGATVFTLNTTIPEMIDSMNSISIVRITFIRCMLVGSVKQAKGFHHFWSGSTYDVLRLSCANGDAIKRTIMQ